LSASANVIRTLATLAHDCRRSELFPERAHRIRANQTR
jgi:hypothetical protein